MRCLSRLSFESLEERALFAGDLPALAIAGDAIELPGTLGDIVTLSATWTIREAEYNNEFILFDLDDASGAVQGLAPDDSGYALLALQSIGAEVIFTSGQGVGDSNQFTRPGGTSLGSAIIQDSSIDDWLRENPTNALSAKPAFFSFADSNPDTFDHLEITQLPGGAVQLAWEDLAYGGDQDFSDVVLTLEVVSIEQAAPEQLHFELLNASAGVGVDPDTGAINWDELGEGTYTFTVSVTTESAPSESSPIEEPTLPPGEIPGLSSNSEVFVEDFETGTIADFWTECSFCGPHSVVTDDGTGNRVFDTFYDHDEQSAQLSVWPLQDVESVFVSFVQKLPTGLPERALKAARVFSADGEKDATFSMQFWPLEGVQKLVTEQQTVNGGGDYTAFDAGFDQWVRVSFLMRQNDPGVKNGVLQVWRNDVILLDRDDVLFRNTDVQPDGIWIGGNYSGNGQDPEPFFRLIDDIMIVTNPALDFNYMKALDSVFANF